MVTHKNEVSFLKVLQWSDEQCRDYLESMRWPDGPVCPKCGESEPYTINRKSRSKNKVTRLYKCRACKRQFSPTVGTIFEDSKIPLQKWFAAIYLMCASKKGISAHQLHRQLDITYKSAWFMAHRVREAMRGKGLSPLTGTIEADETYVGGKTKWRGHRVWREREADEVEMGIRQRAKPYTKKDKTVVFGMLERGGRARTMVVPENTRRQLEPIMLDNIDLAKSRLMTDKANAYKVIKTHLPHKAVDHSLTYVDGDVHTQSMEGYWSLLKRGLYGTFHHVDAGYLDNYLNEFEFRYNSRKRTDQERFGSLIRQTRGRLTWFCQTPQPENPHA